MPPIASGKTIIYKSNCNLNPVATLLDLPLVGAENTLYIVKDTAAIYIWDGAEYIIYDSRPYKVYTALLDYSGSGSINVDILENTLSGPIVWTVVANKWIGTLASAFTSNKTFIQATGPGFLTVIDTIRVLRSSANTVEIWGTDSTGATNSLDSFFDQVNVEIRVYP